MIRVSAVSKTYAMEAAAVHALNGVSLDVDRGEHLAVLGPSGSGKSTLMHIIGCLDTPTAGTYHLDGTSVGQLSREQLADIRNQSIGFVFQSFHLLPRSTAVENVELPLVFANAPPSRSRRRATELLERVGLGHRLHHAPNELSGGERQRVAIARALVNDPLVILADEPTGNLDSASSQEILSLFDELNGDGKTLIVVTHETEVARHAARVIRLFDGEIVEDTKATAMPSDASTD